MLNCLHMEKKQIFGIYGTDIFQFQIFQFQHSYLEIQRTKMAHQSDAKYLTVLNHQFPPLNKQHGPYACQLSFIIAGCATNVFSSNSIILLLPAHQRSYNSLPLSVIISAYISTVFVQNVFLLHASK